MIIKSLNCYILLMLSIILVNSKEIFDLRADDFMDDVLSNVYKGKFEKSMIAYKTTSKFTTTPVRTTRKASISGITKHPAYTNADNMTIDDFAFRKREMDLEVLLESNISLIPKFDGNDEIEVQTRRFNKANALSNKENYRRELYSHHDNATFVYVEKLRTTSLMAQFVYETRYQLPYAQLLRKKYIRNTKYRIGYCFALLRTLKQQQMIVYNTMKVYHEKYLPLFLHMKLYEKVIKLNGDIRDLIKFIVSLDKIRQMEERNKSTSRKQK